MAVTAVSVIQIDAADTHDLRRRVLRSGTPSTEVVFDGDADPATVHLGAVVSDSADGVLVGIATVLPRHDPERPDATISAYQLRGMATEPTLRGLGIGAALLNAAIETATSRHAHELWARARMTALGFYLGAGFETYGPEVLDATTGLPHQHVRLALRG